MKKWCLLVIGLCLSPWLEAQPVILDLQKCRDMALENSKKLQAAEQQQQKALYEQRSYRANFLPKISASGLYAYMNKKMDYSIDGGYLPVFKPDASGTLQPDLLINPETGLPVVGADGNPVFNSYAFMPDIALELGLRNVYSVGVARAEVLIETDEAYWQYVRVRELVKVAEKYVEVVAELVKNVTDGVETGMVSRNDLLKAQVKQNEAELQLSKAKNGLKLAGMNLCRVIGVGLDTELEVRDSLQAEPVSTVLEEGDDIMARPEYNLLEKQVELKEREVALARADFLPQLGVTAGYGYGDGITLNGESSGVASFTAMASLKIPIYYWGEGRNKVKALKAEENMARLQQEELTQMMQLEMAKARCNVEDALVRVKMTEKSLGQAEENLQESKNRYEVGMEAITDYMEAQAQWQQAWSDAIDAKAELRLSETYYLKAAGRL